MRPGTAPNPAQIQRRTLPGRTRIAGVAHPDVAEIELQTPRDVRLLRPTGPHRAYIAVYDGVFTGGKITARIRFKDGTNATVTQPASP